MIHRCSKCGQPTEVNQGELYLPCEHDYLEDVVTEYVCPECEAHRLPEESSKRNHWQCPDCGSDIEFA